MFDYITCLGNLDDVRVASGTPYFFYEYSKKKSFIKNKIILKHEHNLINYFERYAWNFFSILNKSLLVNGISLEKS